MAPIYDSDLAEDRYSKEEWNRYELWERVELRLRRRKRLWIAGACLGFVLLSSVPIVMDRLPKWRALAATRRLAEEINRIKLEASQSHAAYRIGFRGKGQLQFVVERLSDCSAAVGVPMWSGEVMSGPGAGDYLLVGPEQGASLGIRGFVESICYDYLSGSSIVLTGDSLAGFGIMPVNDLTNARMDRLATLLVSGPSAEISFE